MSRPETTYLAITRNNEGGWPMATFTATSRKKAAAHAMDELDTDTVTVYILPAHATEPVTYTRRTVTTTIIEETP